MEGSTWLSDLVTGVYDDIVGFFNNILAWTSAKVVSIAEKGGTWLSDLITGIYEDIKAFFINAFTFVKGTGGVYAFTLYDTVTTALEDALDAVKALFSTDGLTIENLTNLFGSLFDVVTAPIKAAFEAIRSIFSPMDAAETEKLKKDYSLFDLLTGIVKDTLLTGLKMTFLV